MRNAAHQDKVLRYYNTWVKSRKFNTAYLVLRKAHLLALDPTEGKLRANWEGPLQGHEDWLSTYIPPGKPSWKDHPSPIERATSQKVLLIVIYSLLIKVISNLEIHFTLIDFGICKPSTRWNPITVPKRTQENRLQGAPMKNNVPRAPNKLNPTQMTPLKKSPSRELVKEMPMPARPLRI